MRLLRGMEKLSYRDHVRLGLGGRKASGNIVSPNLPHRNSDIDFDDVFGGPPRCSISEMQRSLKESMDSYSFRRGEETPPPRNPWSCLSEKPVFGEDSPSRRRCPSDDFFDDIFKVEDTISSPRKPDRDIFSSTPPSRILSPTRPLPPSRESFVGGSSLPTHFSLSSKPRKGIDSPTFSTPCHSPTSFKDGGSNVFGFLSPPSFGVSRPASQAVPEVDDSRYDTQPSYRYSRLSHEFTLSRDISSKAGESATRDTEGCFVEKGHGRSEASNDSSQFHFSIYKWASKGVMLMMPAKGRNRINTKERDKNESIVTGLPAPVLQGAKLCSLDETSSTAGSSFRSQQDNQDNGLYNNLNSMRKDNVDEAAVPSEPESNPVYNLDSHDTGESGKENKVHSGMSAGPPDGGSRKGAKKEAGKPEVKSLGFLFKCSSDDLGNGVVKLSGGEDGLPRLNNLSAGNATGSLEVKKHVGREVVSDNARTTSLQDGPVNSDDKMLGNRVKGKVKEYVKIFSQEASLQLSSDVDARGHSSRRKESGACKIDKPLPVKAIVSDGQDKINNENCETSATNPIIAEQVLKQAAKEHIDVGAQKVHDYSLERNDTSEASPGFNGTLDNIDESHCEDIHVSCLVEEVPTDLNVQPLPNKPQEEIQTLDLKIRQWSSGKEGNIRSLLSTLQYVLWPDSGWKPVPLVDIIEGSSVRKAYQKALLCLHPDKLQQRGAALDQKYIAEKVFDILQEAWTHFSSVCPIVQRYNLRGLAEGDRHKQWQPGNHPQV